MRVAMAPGVQVEAVIERGRPAAVEVVGVRDTFPEEEVRVPLDPGCIAEWVRREGARWETAPSPPGAQGPGEGEEVGQQPMVRVSAVDCIHVLTESGVLSSGNA